MKVSPRNFHQRIQELSHKKHTYQTINFRKHYDFMTVDNMPEDCEQQFVPFVNERDQLGRLLLGDNSADVTRSGNQKHGLARSISGIGHKCHRLHFENVSAKKNVSVVSPHIYTVLIDTSASIFSYRQIRSPHDLQIIAG